MRVMLMLFLACFAACVFAHETELTFYRPGQAVEKNITGECAEQSQHIKREDAWRCKANERIYDPCFISSSSTKQAICFKSPWVTEAVLIHLKSQVSPQNFLPLNMAETYPWALELSTGEKCVAVHSHKSIDGLPVRYRCEKQRVLFGHLQRCKANWSILFQDASGEIDTIDIAKAWF